MHIILENSKIYSNRDKKMHEGYRYNAYVGYWVSNITNEPLIMNEKMELLATKKEDIETGEDQKGE